MRDLIGRVVVVAAANKALEVCAALLEHVFGILNRAGSAESGRVNCAVPGVRHVYAEKAAAITMKLVGVEVLPRLSTDTPSQHNGRTAPGVP
jgi:hypothetical protein